MGFLIGAAAKLVGARFAPLLAYGSILLVLVAALWWLRADAYSDGAADTDDKWIAAGEKLKEQAAKAAGKADDASAQRIDKELDRVQLEKEKLDAADENGGSPLDVLFGA